MWMLANGILEFRSLKSGGLMPNRDGTGPGFKKNPKRKGRNGNSPRSEKRQLQSCRQTAASGSQMNNIENWTRCINTIKFVTLGFFTVLLLSAIRFGKLLIADRRDSFPQLGYKSDNKKIKRLEQNN